jgi:hypothetical protein
LTASRSSSRSTRSSSGGFSPATLNADGLQGCYSAWSQLCERRHRYH